MSAVGDTLHLRHGEAVGTPTVCIVGPLPPPWGGMANQCEQLGRLLRRDGVAVEIVRSNADYRPRWLDRVPVLRAGVRLMPYLWNLWRAAGRAGVMHVLANSGWAWHLFAAPAVWIARLRGVPVVVNYRGGQAAEFFATAPKHVFMTLRMASALVAPSQFLQRVFSSQGLEVTIVPNIVDLSRFMPAPPRAFGNAPHVIVTRNLEAIYDIGTAIRAFATLHRTFTKARLTIAGIGPELESLQRLVSELRLEAEIHFAGRIPNEDIPALYASADCMLNPSTVDNMPISILEAFASGVPVITTDAGGIGDMVENGVSAMVVPIGDERLMAQAAARVLGRPEIAQRLRATGLETAERYAWPTVREQWLTLYRHLASGDSA
jgi:glycosyltransferase involved in cell wall biosynthesis